MMEHLTWLIYCITVQFADTLHKISLQDIFICHEGHHVRLSNYSGIISCQFLVRRLVPLLLLSVTLTNHYSRHRQSCRGGGIRKMPEGGTHHVYIRVRALWPLIGQCRSTCHWRCQTRQENTKPTTFIADQSDFFTDSWVSFKLDNWPWQLPCGKSLICHIVLCLA